jgi:hypothetical protein
MQVFFEVIRVRLEKRRNDLLNLITNQFIAQRDWGEANAAFLLLLIWQSG